MRKVMLRAAIVLALGGMSMGCAPAGPEAAGDSIASVEDTGKGDSLTSARWTSYELTPQAVLREFSITMGRAGQQTRARVVSRFAKDRTGLAPFLDEYLPKVTDPDTKFGLAPIALLSLACTDANGVRATKTMGKNSPLDPSTDAAAVTVEDGVVSYDEGATPDEIGLGPLQCKGALLLFSDVANNPKFTSTTIEVVGVSSTVAQ